MDYDKYLGPFLFFGFLTKVLEYAHEDSSSGIVFFSICMQRISYAR